MWVNTGQEEPGSEPSGNRVTGTRSMSKVTEHQEVALATPASERLEGHYWEAEPAPERMEERLQAHRSRSQHCILQGPVSFLEN